ncbi:MAG: ankyrin repeat domain-containing protein [Akkermansia sp.]|nr:ankyrin repeat domain-containing protein [Akkermansia sp.]
MSRQKVRQIGRYIGYTLAGLLVTLLLAAGGGALWLWGWTWKSAPCFHESWSVEERSAITEFDAYLREQYAADVAKEMVSFARAFQSIEGAAPSGSGLGERLAAAYVVRLVAAPVSEWLHEFAESGDASSSASVHCLDVHGLTPAILAAQTAHLKALEALVQHGANPDALAFREQEYTDSMEIETVISPLLSGHFTNGRQLPWETRRQTAEFLLAHGADLNVSRRINQLSCDLSLVAYCPEGVVPWMWALNHGMRMNPEDLMTIVCYAEARPALELAVREKRVDVNDASYRQTVLQSLMSVLLRPYDEEMWQEEQPDRFVETHLALLLAAGADPNLIPKEAEPQRTDESDDAYEERLWRSDARSDTPLDIATQASERATLPAHRELCRRVIEKLRHAGAKLKQPESGGKNDDELVP